MKSNSDIENKLVYWVIKELSNRKKFRIIELTQNKEVNITLIAREIKLAYNKCSDYCAKLEKVGLAHKRKQGKEVFVKSRLNLGKLASILCIN